MAQQDVWDLSTFVISVVVGFITLGFCGTVLGVSFAGAAFISSLFFAVAFMSFNMASGLIRHG